MEIAKFTLREKLVVTGTKVYVGAERLELECDEGGEGSARSGGLKG